MTWEQWRLTLANAIFSGYEVINVIPYCEAGDFPVASTEIDMVIIVAYNSVKNEYVSAYMDKRTYAHNEWWQGNYRISYKDALHKAADMTK
jgi:hypothetical protein